MPSEDEVRLAVNRLFLLPDSHYPCHAKNPKQKGEIESRTALMVDKHISEIRERHGEKGAEAAEQEIFRGLHFSLLLVV